MKVCLGGTFSIIHEGHRALLQRACREGDKVIVGLTSDRLARQRGKTVPSYETRKQRLQSFARQVCSRTVDIVPLEDEYGPAATGACDGIVVSPETAAIAEKINDIRQSNDIAPLHIYVVPYVLADDGIPVSSSRIDRGDIENGHRIVPLHVAVGTSSELKHGATARAFQRLYSHLDIQCSTAEVPSMESPTDEQTWQGARQRAKQSIGSADYGIGIEAGITTRQDRAMLMHVCAIVDSAGYLTWGTAPAFMLPAGIAENGMDIADLVPDDHASLAGYLSDGRVTREHLVEEAVTMALLPRLRGRH